MKKAVIAIVCLLSIVFFSFPVVAVASQEMEDELLGTVSAQYESNGNPGLISGGAGDLGGASYGAYQFASRHNIPHTFAQWCVSSGKNTTVGNRLLEAYKKDNNQLGETFNAVWKAIAEENKEEFLKLQRLYVKAKYYDPAVEALQEYFDLDISLYGIAFKNAVWSRTLQHGLGSYTNENGFLGILKRVAANVPMGIHSLSEEKLITAIYEESGALTDQGTNPMLVANAGGNAWIIRTYNLEGKYMKYYSGNSAAVQAGVYLRLRVKEIADLLSMLETYGGYGGEENGRCTPVLKDNQLVLSSCDELSGLYGSSQMALSLSGVDKKEGSGALNLIPVSVEQDLSVLLKCNSLVDFSSFAKLQFFFYLPSIVWSEFTQLTICGIINEETVTPVQSVAFSSLKSGWQTLSLTIPKGFEAQWLLFNFEGLPESAVNQRFMLDSIVAIPKTATAFDTYRVNATALHCRTLPSSNGTSLGLFPQKGTVTVMVAQGDWLMCTGVDQNGVTVFGWSSKSYLQKIGENGLTGDVNGDQQITSIDALHILQYAVSKRKFDANQLLLADLNGDVLANAKDALLVLRIVVHKG